MTEQAQVGDTVRLTITAEGVVSKWQGELHVMGFTLVGIDRTVEILSRAIPPLPTAAGYYLGYNKVAEADFLIVVIDGVIHLPDATKLGGIGIKVGFPERFAPFHRLVLQ